MPNPYPARFTDETETARLEGEIDFTDPANQPGGGGSQATSRWVDCGVIDLAALAAGNIPVKLVAFVAGEYISQVRYLLDGFVAPDNGYPEFALYTPGTLAGAGLGWFSDPNWYDTSGWLYYGSGLAPNGIVGSTAMVADPGPLYISAVAAGTYSPVQPAIPWTALTSVAAQDWHIASDGYVYEVTTPGLTGAAEPIWPGAGYTVPVVDGGAAWSQLGLAPTVGAIHVLAELVSPV